MMKWLLHLVMICLVAGSWVMFSNSGKKVEAIKHELNAEYERGDPDGKVAELEQKRDAAAGERTFTGVLLTFVSAGLVGIFFVVYLLPFFAQRATHAIYDSAEMVERDVMHNARSLVAQGDFQGAIEAFKEAAAADPLNRLPWVEISKIYKDNLDDPDSAVQTIRYALESQEWQVNDAAFFLFRLAELYDEVKADRASARAIMQQVIEEFPNTRHSANANHKLHDWDVEEAEAAKAAGQGRSVAGGIGSAEPAPGAVKRYDLPVDLPPPEEGA